MKKWLVIAILLLIGMGPVPRLWGGAGAQEAGGLGIIPAVVDANDPNGSWFVYELEPGKTINEKAAVINLYDEPVEVEVYPVDATTTKDGAFSLKQKNDEIESVGGWVEGLPLKLSLQAKERQIIDFSFTIPEGTEPGDYLGGLVVQKVSVDETKMQVKTVVRTGVRIYLTVPGEVKREIEVTKLEFKKIKGKYKLLLSLKNTGNVRLENMLVKLNLKSKWGWPPESRASYPQAAVMFPGKEISLELPWENSKPILGQFDLKIEVIFGEILKINKSLSLWMIDWLKLGIAIGSLIVLIVWFKLTAKKRKQKKLLRQKQKIERKKMIGFSTNNRKLKKHGDEVDWLLKEIRVIIREELQEMARNGQLDDFKKGSRKRLKTPRGLKLPRGIHSEAVSNGNKKKFFFSKLKQKSKK